MDILNWIYLKTHNLIKHTTESGSIVAIGNPDKRRGDRYLTTAILVNDFPESVPVTFTELTSLISTSSLVIGKYYLITDYQTIYDQPDYDITGTPKTVVATLTGPVEPLLTLAVSSNGIAEQVWSTQDPIDYILYDINFIQTEVMLAPAKGRILQRTNESRNTIGYDHKVVVLKRYESSIGSGIFNQIKDNGNLSVNFPTFGLGCETVNCSYIREEEAGFDDPIFIVSNNVFGEYCEELYCAQDFYNNTIGDLAYGSLFGHWCHDNIIGNGFVNNHIGNEFSFNNIGNNCSSNRIGNFFKNNNIGVDFMSNAISNDFGSNGGNTIGDQFYSNTIEDQFFGNTIGDGFIHNYIDDYFTNCTLNNNFQYNDIKVACDGTEAWNTAGANAYTTSYTTVINGFNSTLPDGQRIMGWYEALSGTFVYTGL